jgi:DNA-binding transcriptional LysR family regulator
VTDIFTDKSLISRCSAWLRNCLIASIAVVADFMSVPIVVAETDAVAIVPQALGDFARTHGGLQEIPMPFVPPTFQVNLFWHRSAHNDPSNVWLRELIISKFPALRARQYARNGELQGNREV